MSSVFKIDYFMWNFSGTRCIQVGRFRSSVTERFLLHLSFTFQWLQLHIALFACFVFQSLFLCDFLFLFFFFFFTLSHFHSLGWFSVLLQWKVNKFSFKSFPFWVAFNLVFIFNVVLSFSSVSFLGSNSVYFISWGFVYVYVCVSISVLSFWIYISRLSFTQMLVWGCLI